MNIIYAEGGRKKEREIAENVVNWCIKKMMPKMRTLEIAIEFDKLDDAYGYCMEGDNSRTFTLSIKKGLDLYALVSTVCHEMVHVKQYARKELRHVHGNTMWKKEVCNDVSYDDAPWEIEAYALEDELAKECIAEINIKI